MLYTVISTPEVHTPLYCNVCSESLSESSVDEGGGSNKAKKLKDKDEEMEVGVEASTLQLKGTHKT